MKKKVIDDETKIDATLDAYNEFHPIAEIAKQDDTIRNYEAKLKAAQPSKDKDDKTDKTDADKPEKPDLPDDTPAYMKTFMQQTLDGFNKLSGIVTAMQSEKSQISMRQKIAEKLKDVAPEVFWSKRVLPEKDEDLETFITDVTTDYTALNKERTDAGLSALTVPKSGKPGTKDENGKATKEELDAIVKNIM